MSRRRKMYYYEEAPIGPISRTPAETKVFKYVDCSVVEKSPTSLTAMCKPNTLIKVYKGEGEGGEYVVEFTDTDTGLTEKHRVDLSAAVVVRRYLESRSR
ncbi:MAG: hypothetical protein ACPL3C_06080 [Pyrobaculum sp.]|uniref:Uncharacterized protein n=1 Tax=Pyrobaculum ferrireducens TaxID=1104324 RepID=G7VHR0_9CREN|nr:MULTISPECIES: hypothetical protein [Pyrobaculum]AET32082.1 hypothetical protein P186_0630 [Pyrobaculum ferrireducens]MCU7786650.1 hypothetical protein [Pyrobaculum sp. 3827-6]